MDKDNHVYKEKKSFLSKIPFSNYRFKYLENIITPNFYPMAFQEWLFVCLSGIVSIGLDWFYVYFNGDQREGTIKELIAPLLFIFFVILPIQRSEKKILQKVHTVCSLQVNPVNSEVHQRLALKVSFLASMLFMTPLLVFFEKFVCGYTVNESNFGFMWPMWAIWALVRDLLGKWMNFVREWILVYITVTFIRMYLDLAFCSCKLLNPRNYFGRSNKSKLVGVGQNDVNQNEVFRQTYG